MNPVSEHVVGFLDLGTNSVRLLLVRIHPNRSFVIIGQHREMVRLGEGEFTESRLQPEAIERTVLVCRKFAEVARSHGASEIIAVTTSAAREASNQGELLRRLQDEAQVDIRVISGQEEARLIYLGVSSSVHLGERLALFIDIGGGSTEIIVGNQREYQYLDSLKLGAIRLSALFFSDSTGPIPLAQYERAQQFVRNAAVRTLQRMPHFAVELAFGSSGTIETLAAIAARTLHKHRPTPTEMLTFPDLQRVVDMLRGLSLEERRKVPGMNPERADIIIGGAAIIHTLMQELHVPAITTSPRGLRDGLLADYLQRQVYAPAVTEMSVRARSVLQLGRVCHFDETHAAHTARLALELFDSAQQTGLHKLGAWERELLGWAAQLHDIGMFLSYTNHHAHGHYFIRNADLLGFDQEEIAIMATTVFFHRRVIPRRKHAEFATLDPRAQEVVRVLSVLLRLAESLDRSHAGLVDHVQFELRGKHNLALLLTSATECQLETWGAQSHQEAVMELFGRHLVVETRS